MLSSDELDLMEEVDELSEMLLGNACRALTSLRSFLAMILALLGVVDVDVPLLGRLLAEVVVFADENFTRLCVVWGVENGVENGVDISQLISEKFQMNFD